MLNSMLAPRKETGSVSSTDKGNSDDGSFSFGFSRQLGKRSSMEDFDAVNITRVGNQVVGLFGVFDGHGGSRAAKYVKEHLFENLINHPKFLQDTKAAIVESFETTDKEYLNSENGFNRDAGSTASIAVLVDKLLYVANVGDSRAVICKAGQATTLSTDHKPNKSEERERIEQAGGYVMWAGTWRVGGVLAVSRAFGDKLLKKYVIPIPDIQVVSIDPEVEFLIVASDGLWDVVTEQEAIKMVQSLVDAEAAAKHLAEEALRRGSSDNITCLVLRFHHSL